MSTPIQYREAPREFTKWGTLFTRVKREGDVIMYRRSWSRDKFCFEIMIIRRHDGREVHGAIVPPSEYLPGDNE